MAFFGLIIAPGKKYEKVVDPGFVVTMAALSPDAKKGSRTSLIIEMENTEFVSCTLKAGTVDHQSLNLHFAEGSVVGLRSEGDAEVHLTGYHPLNAYGNDDDDMGMFLGDSDESEDDEDFSFDDNDSESDGSNSVGIQELDDDMDSEDDEDFVPEQKGKRKRGDDGAQSKKRAKADAEAKAAAEKEAKMKAQAKAKAKAQAKEAEEKAKKAKLAKAKKQLEEQKKQKAAKAKEEAEKPQQKAKKPVKQAKPEKLCLSRGVVAEVVGAGTGKVAKAGRKVHIKYAGRLAKTKKQFDAGTINFFLGRGEVIKGWDVGIEGMKVGEKRRLTIPAPMAYGRKGAGRDIPPNSTLIFDVELLRV